MIYKVFYQETKERSPRRETTRALYLDIDAPAQNLRGVSLRQHLSENRTQSTISNISNSCLTNCSITKKKLAPSKLRSSNMAYTLKPEEDGVCHLGSQGEREKHLRN